MRSKGPKIQFNLESLAETHVNDGGAAVQVFVQVVQHLSQLLHVLLVGLQQHGLEVHRQSVSVDTQGGLEDGHREAEDGTPLARG